MEWSRGLVSEASERIGKRSVTIAGHRTSVSLEVVFWERLILMAARRGVSLSSLIAEVDRTRVGNLSSALRVRVLLETAAAPEAASLSAPPPSWFHR